TKIAKSHGKTSAQIILRWQIQAGYVVIPGSQNPSHIAENFDIFDFELTQNEMKEISNLNQNRRFENW
ncbi:MAG: aldo/keto reductase, partial [Synergistaceae bacterium]|nr:aldo/keto reductase [Synergistaceae bacterium]